MAADEYRPERLFTIDQAKEVEIIRTVARNVVDGMMNLPGS